MSKIKRTRADAPAIISERTVGTNMMRGRDVRHKLTLRNVDPEVVSVMANIAEINHTNSLAIAELATMLDKIVNIVQQFSDVAENMKNRTDQMARAMGDIAEENETEQ